MKRAKKMMVLVLALSFLFANVQNVMAVSAIKEIFGVTTDGTRMNSDIILLEIGFVNGEVVVECEVQAPDGTTSIDVLYVLREENAAGNLALRDNWNDSGSGDYYFNDFFCGPAVEGNEYEVTIRVGIYNKNGLVGYDYKTVSGIY